MSVLLRSMAVVSLLALLQASPAIGGNVYSKSEVDAMVAGLQSQIQALQYLLEHFSRAGNDITVSGANLRIVSGTNATWGPVNGLGNLIVGYDEADYMNSWGRGVQKTGSHNIVVGPLSNYSGYGGIVVGQANDIAQPYAAAVGGSKNFAYGWGVFMGGGLQNRAVGTWSASLGGEFNEPQGGAAATVGGHNNRAVGARSTITGGINNYSIGESSSVSGGSARAASGSSSWAAGALYEAE